MYLQKHLIPPDNELLVDYSQYLFVFALITIQKGFHYIRVFRIADPLNLGEEFDLNLENKSLCTTDEK